MKVTLPNFRLSNVLVVGDVMLDRYWYGLTSRISPEAPVPIVKVDVIEERPGGAANVAMNIAALGCHARLVGLTGIDAAARILGEQLRKAAVICDFISVSIHPTIIKLRVLSRNQQLIRLDFEQCFDNVDYTPMLERIQLALPKTDALVLSDYAKGALACVREIMILAQSAGVPVLVDPTGTDFSRYQGAALLTPNLSEFEAVVGICKNEEILVNCGMKIIADYQVSALLITRSEQGMILLQRGKDPLYLPAQAKEVYDVTGAGDTVIGVLAAALAAGNSLEESCYLANSAAGVVVGKLGASTVSPIELKNSTPNCAKMSFGIITESELKQVIALSRQRGEKIVMTNGIFDILHAGHVNYLTNARRLGDRLIVAVNSDSSTKRLKGEKRPINSLEKRMTVLSALKVVDWVVSFNEDTPQRLISEVLPDVLVKGGDYKLHQIAGSKEVLDNKGDVLILNFEDNCSTTSIIKSMKHSERG